ncbi:MAG: hypothetical protein AB1918_02380, partial [Pseudomonadota bacterium]
MALSALLRKGLGAARRWLAGIGPGRKRPAPEGRAVASAHDRRGVRRVGYLDPRLFVSALVGFGRRDARERLHIFSLADFRLAAGGKWERLSGLVELALDQIIRRHIDPTKDFYTRLDAETACLVIPRAPRPEARARVAAIASDLSAHLFGTVAVEGRRPQIVAVNVGLGEVIREGGGLRVAAIRDAVAGATPAVPPVAKAVDLGAVHRTTLAALMGGHDAFAISGGGARQSSEPQWVTLKQERSRFDGELPVLTAEGRGPRAEMTVLTAEGRGPRGEMAVLTAEGRGPRGEMAVLTAEGRGPRGEMAVLTAEGRRPGDGAQWLDAALESQAAAAAAAPRHLAPVTSLALVWTPSWVTSLGGIGAYHARVVRQDDEGEPVLEGVLAYGGAGPVEALTIDRFVAGQAARELRSIATNRQRVGLTVPFHWMSLAPRWRDCIRLPFEDVPPHARRRLLKIEIFGLTTAVPPAILGSLFGPLEGLGCDVLVRLPLSAPEMVGSMPGVRAVGVDLAELPEGERVGDDELFARLRHFREVARQAKAACYVWGIRRRQMGERVVPAGCS